ncbi:MAG TPA: xylulokinase [bacterium]|nr:xylulokinase [bacterium]
MKYLLGVDLGTSGVKALVIDPNGHIVAKTTAEYPLHTPQPLWAEQEPADWWQAFIVCCRCLWNEHGVDPQSLFGIGLTGQMHGLVLLDAHGDVLRSAILWNDQRTGPQCARLTEQLGLKWLLAETANPLLPGFTAPKLVWVRENEPDIFSRAAHFLLPKDYLRYRLTGELATDVADASGTSLFDVRRRRWSEEMFAALDIPRAWAPSCGESIEISGRVNQTASDETGLPAGLPVIAGAGDQAAQAVGSGLTQAGQAAATIGTSGVVFAPTIAPQVDAQGRLHTFCHAIPGMWHVMGVMLAAGGSLQWFRNQLGQEEIAQAHAENVDPYEVLLRAAESIAPGCDGLQFLPYLSGERTPYADPLARGAFIGLTLRHTKAHLIRAVLEGVTFGLRDCLELMRAAGVEPQQMRVSGGGARSALWRQIIADVFDCETVTVNAVEGAAFGAALLAGVGVDIWPDVPTACAHTIRRDRATCPQPATVNRYREHYAVYRQLYPALRDIFTIMK